MIFKNFFKDEAHLVIAPKSFYYAIRDGVNRITIATAHRDFNSQHFGSAAELRRYLEYINEQLKGKKECEYLVD